MDKSGNVGIGTTDPAVRLSLGNPADGTKSLAIYENGLANSFYGFGNNTSRLEIFAGLFSDPARMVIDNAGNVGIGTTSTVFDNVTDKVSILSTRSGSVQGAMLTLIDDTAQAAGTGGGLSFVGKYTDAGAYASAAAVIAQKSNSTTGNFGFDLAFYTRVHGGNMTQKMVIDTAGNVGIGTTDPTTGQMRLAVQFAKTDTSTRNALFVGSNEAVASNPFGVNISVTGHATTLASRYVIFETTDYNSAAGGNLVLQPSTGFVGIGMTNPSVALDVTGDIEYTGTITDVSDVRLKENITDFNGALGIVSSLQAKTYNMIGDPESEVGFIAQDVQALFPGATSTIDPTNGYLGVSYVSLIPIISQAVKEMNLNLEGIAGTTTPLPGSASESFATAFFTNLKTTLSAWLADAGNGITDIFANKATLDQVCLKDTNGTSCYTRTQLDTLLAGAGGSIVNNTGSGTTTTSTTPAATCSDGIQNQDETGIDTGGVCATPDSSTPDTTAPVITLTGEITINLNVGDTYTEQGANATDNVDASVAVIISGSVDTATAGTYTIHYNASDTAGNPATEITRTVNVAAAL